MGTEGGEQVGGLALCRIYQKERRTIVVQWWVMVEASSHVPLYSLVESTLLVYGARLFFVSARTNKRHHHPPESTMDHPHTQHDVYMARQRREASVHVVESLQEGNAQGGSCIFCFCKNK